MSPDEVLALLPADDVALLDRLAEQTGHAVAFEAVRQTYETDERLRVPPRIISGGAKVKSSVDLEAMLG